MSSFQKTRKTNVIKIPGTTPSLQNLQLLLSTGIPSLDKIFGGGVPVGSIFLIEEDSYDVYSKLFVKFYLSEGAFHKHALYVSSLTEDPMDIVRDLPEKCKNEEVSNTTKDMNEKLHIAWQYQKQNVTNHSVNKPESFFDLSKRMTMEELCPDKLFYWPQKNGKETDAIGYSCMSLLNDIKAKIDNLGLKVSNRKGELNVLRVVIHSFLSPFWENNGDLTKITTFLTLLRAVARTSFCSILITVPSQLVNNYALINRIHGMVDFAIRLESFQGSDKETNKCFKDYHGLFHVTKISAINSIVPPSLTTPDWAFCLKRRTLNIEKLSLPPELPDVRDEKKIDSGSTALSHKDLEF